MENEETSHRESDDNYARIVASLNNRWRVILCKDGLQWVLQWKRKSSDKWDGHSFCQARDALLRCIREKVEDVYEEDLEPVKALPVRTSLLWKPV